MGDRAAVPPKWQGYAGGRVSVRVRCERVVGIGIARPCSGDSQRGGDVDDVAQQFGASVLRLAPER